MRTPALPWDEAEGWTEGTGGCQAQQGDTDLLRERLRTMLRNPSIRLAIYVASPSLHQRLGRWLAGQDGRSAARVELAVARYVMRMIGRATPFGLFAGTAAGDIGPHTNLVVPPIEATIRHSRFDFEFVQRVAKRIRRDVQSQLRFHAPSDSYARGRSLRYVDQRQAGAGRSHGLVEVEATPALNGVLSFLDASDGATVNEISNHIVAAEGIEPGDAGDFVDELIEAGLLNSALGPSATGTDALGSVAGTLGQLPSAAGLVAALDDIQSDLAATDRAAPDVASSLYENAQRRLSDLAPPTSSRSSFHVDLYKPTPGLLLDEDVVEDVVAGVELMRRMATDRPSPLQDFSDRFVQRYGEQEVLLLEALDPTSGLPFEDGRATATMPLVDGLALRGRAKAPAPWSLREAVLLDGLHDVWRSGALELAVSDQMLAALPANSGVAIPASCSALVSLAAASNEAIGRGEYRLLFKAVFGRSCAALLGRFCIGNPEIAERVRLALGREEAWEPDTIHAEIAYLPHGGAGNVVNRPVLRQYEIDMFGGSGAGRQRRIALNDLSLVFRNGRLCLISSSHGGKRVVPHLTCAHAPTVRDPVHYRFLARLAEDRSPHIRFSWGSLRTAPFLPRLARGRVIITTARWNIPAQRLEALHATHGRERFANLRKLREELRLPRYINLYHGDENLPVDLDNAISVASFLGIVKRHATVSITEMYPAPDQLCARGPEGRFVNELIVPLHRSLAGEEGARKTPVPALPRSTSRDRVWLFAKVYCSRLEADRLLGETILPLVDNLRGRRLIERWHFVRYADPEPHIRLRLRGDRRKLYRRALPYLIENLQEPDAAFPLIAFDTYVPEYIRYGGREGLDVAERIFEVDSWAATGLIKRHSGDEEARWRLALLGVHTFLEAFDWDIDSRIQFLDAIVQHQRERRKGAPLERELGRKFRNMRPAIENLLASPSAIYPEAADILNRRSHQLRTLIAELLSLDRNGRLGRSVADIARSCVHMWLNRIFADEQNLQELVVNAMLTRWYQSVRARSGTASGSTGTNSQSAVPGR